VNFFFVGGSVDENKLRGELLRHELVNEAKVVSDLATAAVRKTTPLLVLSIIQI